MAARVSSPSSSSSDERGGPERVAQRDVVEVEAARARDGSAIQAAPAAASTADRGQQHAPAEPAQQPVVVGEAEQPRAAVERRGPARSAAGQPAERDHGQRRRTGSSRVGHGQPAEERQQQRREQDEPEEVPQVPGRRSAPAAPAAAGGSCEREEPEQQLPVPGTSPPSSIAGTAISGEHPQRRQQPAQPASTAAARTGPARPPSASRRARTSPTWPGRRR